MPSDNPDAYKRMYEMGQEMMDMAKAGGYDPEGGSEDREMSEDYSSEKSMGSDEYKGKDKIKAALSLM